MNRVVDSELRCETSSRNIHEGLDTISPRAGEDKSAWRVRGKEEDGEFGGDRRRAFYKPVVVTALFFFLSLEPRVSQPPHFRLTL